MLGSEGRYLRVVIFSEDLQENPMDPGCLDGWPYAHKKWGNTSCYDSKSPFYYTHPVTSICYTQIYGIGPSASGNVWAKIHGKNPSWWPHLLNCERFVPKINYFCRFFCVLNFCRFLKSQYYKACSSHFNVEVPFQISVQAKQIPHGLLFV